MIMLLIKNRKGRKPARDAIPRYSASEGNARKKRKKRKKKEKEEEEEDQVSLPFISEIINKSFLNLS